MKYVNGKVGNWKIYVVARFKIAQKIQILKFRDPYNILHAWSRQNILKIAQKWRIFMLKFIFDSSSNAYILAGNGTFRKHNSLQDTKFFKGWKLKNFQTRTILYEHDFCRIFWRLSKNCVFFKEFLTHVQLRIYWQEMATCLKTITKCRMQNV